MGLMNGKVVVVTGAGGGLGRTHALAFAKEGASVVVNDLGGSRDGSGTGTSMAEQVVAEIVKMGGKAVANFDSVSDPEGAERIIQSAVKAFGRLDVLVNNAGILRDKTLLKMTNEEWKPVIAVHLDGTFYCGRAAAKYMSENNIAGRIINTTSYSGLKGNYGQGNYGAAKSGVVALTKIWGMELAKYGITVNAIAPMAKTRMTEDIAAVPDDTQPEHISPLVVFLGSDLSQDVSGRIFGCHGRHYFEYKLELTEGVKKDSDWTPQEIQSKLEAISASAAAAAPVSAAPAASAGTVQDRIAKAFGLMSTAFTADKAAGWTAVIQFVIEGADSYTIHVKDKTVKVDPGLTGTATCKVNVSAETMAGMIEGKISGQSAFMAGKIKATNLGDMMKFGKVFDFKRAREAAGAAAPAAGGAVPAGGDSLTSRIRTAFSLMETAFTPDKAAGWTAVIQFIIEGAENYSIHVKDKAVKVEPGLTGTATCKVNVSADTMAGMIEGKVSGQSAFMAGKIKASNLGDMMKFGKVFDFKRAREAAAKSGGAPAASAPSAASASSAPVSLGTVFEKLPSVFQPDATAGWNGKIVFDVAGTEGYTVTIENKTVAVATSKLPSPICTITGQSADISDVLTGKTDFKTAMSGGKVKASNPMALVKLNQAFNWKGLAAALASAPAAGGVEASGGISPAIVGRKYRSPATFVRPESIRQYALATNEPRPAYAAKGNDKELIATPVFPVTLIGDLFKQMLGDDTGIDLSRMVHGEQTITYYDVLRPWDLVSPRGVITKVEKKGNNEIVTFDQFLYRDGELVTKISSALFVRGAGGSKSSTEEKKAPTPVMAPAKPLYSYAMSVTADQPKRYAEASGDNNPIHLDNDIAKAAGFPSVILHGLCTMAFAGQAVVEKLLGGDIGKLKELSVRFSKPVLPGETITFSGELLPDKSGVTLLGFNPSGAAVLTNGVAKIDSETLNRFK